MKHEPDGFLELFVDGVLASLLLAGLIWLAVGGAVMRGTR